MVRTAFLVAIVMSIGLSMALFAGSGFNALITGSQDSGPLGDAIEEEGDKSVVNQDQNISSDRTGSSGSLAGLILSSARTIGRIVGLVSLLPVTLQRLGFPTWFAVPLGSIVYIVAGLGIVQFLSGRVLQ